MAQVFRPVRSTEEKLFNKNNPISPEEGYLYFTTDTKKIYLGNNGEYLPMGGNSGVYYGNRIPAEGEEDSENITFQFSLSTEIEGSNTPNVDDLILNIPDGCFYRVIAVNVDANTVTADKLTIAGSGSGGGGGITAFRPVINGLSDNDSYFSAIETDKLKLTFSCSSQQPDNNRIERIEYKIGSHTFTINETHQFGDIITIDLSQHLDILSTQAVNNISVQVFDAYDNSSIIRSHSVYLLSLTLKTSQDSIISVKKGNNYTYQFTPIGGNAAGSASAISKHIELTIAPLDSPSVILYSINDTISSTGMQLSKIIPFIEKEEFTHNVYLLTATYYVKIERTGAIVRSNTLQHQIAYIDPESATPLIATNFIDNTTVTQYSTYNLQYMVAKGSDDTDIKVRFYVQNETTEEAAKLNQISTWSYTFVNTGTYKIELEYINEGVKVELGSLNVIQYSSDDIPSIDTSLLEFQLSPLGKTNSQSNKAEWISNYQGHKYEAKFENFLWGNENGWITDKDGPCLKLTNGAKLSVPDYRPFKTSSTAGGFTIELSFKFSKVSDYKKGLIECLCPVYDASHNITRYSAGFQITGEKATLNSSTYSATTTAIGGNEEGNADDASLSAFIQYFGEDTKIHLTYVIEDLSTNPNNEFRFVYTYLNGVLSGIMKLPNGENFVDSGSVPAFLKLDSTYGDIYFYGIRTYRSTITHRAVINDYIADISNIDTKIALAKNNNIFNSSNKVSKEVIDTLSSTLGVKYCIFEGGYSMPKSFKEPHTYTEQEMSRALPTTKKDFRLVSFKMCEKKEDQLEPTVLMDVPIQLGTDEASKENDIYSDTDIKAGTTYYFKRGVQLYGQGTSSMAYPVKNLRLKFINKSDYPTVYEGSMPVQIVCFKADYMDSSSTHNTCTGNLVYDLYNSLKLKTPPQKFIEGQKDAYDIITAIKGFPIICFYKNYNDVDGDEAYTYIGRYNFNLDKATPEPFGFPGQYRYTGKQTSGGRKEVEPCGVRVEEIEGMKVLPLDEDGNEIVEDIVQCWEFRNNDTPSPTKFLTPSEKIGGGKYLNYEDALKQSWFEYYEDRYPDEIFGLVNDNKVFESTPKAEKALEEGLFRMSKWVNSTATTDEEVTNSPLDKDVYYLTLDRDKPTAGISYYDANKQLVDVHSIDAIDIDSSFTGSDEADKIAESNIQVDISVFSVKVGAAYNTYSFSYDGNQWNLLYVENNVIYTIDNVNLADYGVSLINEATAKAGQGINIELYGAYSNWTPNTLYEKHTTDNKRYRLAKFRNEFTEYFDMDFCLFYYILTLTLLMMDSRAKNMMMASWDLKIWYPIFYDMDTILGLNNTGFNKFSYDIEDDPNDKVFNGFDSVLWNNFREVFTDKITTFYNEMRKYMTSTKLLDTYNTKGADVFNEALITMDAIYKYERPYEEGYYDTSGDEPKYIKPGGINYLYVAQGRRSDHRTWWITNRLNYLDSKYKPLSYGNNKPTQSDAFSFRAYALPKQKSDESTDECIKTVPANHKFNITALANSYQSLFIGNIVYGPYYTTAGQTIAVGPDSPKHEVESYILNPSLIQDLGDLSDKYIGSWQMPENKLTELKFGRSQRSHPNNYENYFNSLLTNLSFGTVNEPNTPYLKKLNVARCTGLTVLELDPCSKLEELDAEMSGLTNVVFPESSILQRVYLPKSLGSLKISDQPYLNTIEFDETPDLLTYELINVPNFDSYELTRSVFNKRKNTLNGLSYALTEVNWSIPCGGSSGNPVEIDHIEILDDLLVENTKLVPISGYSLASALTGSITLTGYVKTNEYALYNKYKQSFPNLTIKFEHTEDVEIAKTITFMAEEKDSNDNRIHYQVLSDGSQSLATLTSKNGPLGYAMTAPQKISTQEFRFTYTGRWISDSGDKYVINDQVEGYNGQYDKLFEDAVPKNNLILYPEYKTQKNKYKVSFYDWNNNVIAQEKDGVLLTSWEVEYGSIYDGPIKGYYHRPDTGLGDTERWKFLGWGDRQGDNPKYIDLNTYPIVTNVYLYARYAKENVYDSATSEDYFELDNAYIQPNLYGQNVGGSSGYRQFISIKEEYKNVLAGKITIPATVGGVTVTGVGVFSGANLITHVYFDSRVNNNIVDVRPNAFANPGDAETALKVVDLPESIQRIGQEAFINQRKLEKVSLSKNITHIGADAFTNNQKLKLTSLPESLQYLGNNAFSNAGENVKITTIPTGVESLPIGVFGNSQGIRIVDFGTSGAKLTTIGGYSFMGAKGSGLAPDKVQFGPSITTFGDRCFENSYIAEAAVIYFAKQASFYNEGQYSTHMDLLTYTGFAMDKLETITILCGEEGNMVT